MSPCSSRCGSPGDICKPACYSPCEPEALASVQPLLPDSEIDVQKVVDENPDKRLCRLSDGRLGMDHSGDKREYMKVSSMRNREKRGYLRAEIDGRLQVEVRDTSVKKSQERWPPYESYGVTLNISNTSSKAITDVRVKLSGWDIIDSGEQRIKRLRPGEEREIVVEYVPASFRALFNVDPIWDENVVVAADISFRQGQKRRRAEVPVDYRFYAGWGLSENDSLISMSYAEQPGLRPYVEEARKLAEEEYGAPLDDTPAARIAASKAVSIMLRGLNLTYVSDGLYMRPDRAVFEYVQYPLETLYYGGDCEDFSILHNYFMHELGMGVATIESLMHISHVVELVRGSHDESSIPEEYRRFVISEKCGDDECVVLPVDLTFGDDDELKDIEDDEEWFSEMVAKSSDYWRKSLDRPKSTELITSVEYPPEETPSLGISWFGAMTFIPKAE